MLGLHIHSFGFRFRYRNTPDFGIHAFIEAAAAMGFATDPAASELDPATWRALVEDALEGERDRNDIGRKESVLS